MRECCFPPEIPRRDSGSASMLAEEAERAWLAARLALAAEEGLRMALFSDGDWDLPEHDEAWPPGR